MQFQLKSQHVFLYKLLQADYEIHLEMQKIWNRQYGFEKQKKKTFTTWFKISL